MKPVFEKEKLSYFDLTLLTSLMEQQKNKENLVNLDPNKIESNVQVSKFKSISQLFQNARKVAKGQRGLKETIQKEQKMKEVMKEVVSDKTSSQGGTKIVPK